MPSQIIVHASYAQTAGSDDCHMMMLIQFFSGEANDPFSA
jgi:hypothetical protein